MGVAVDEDGVDVVRAVVALERRDVRPEVVGCIREKDKSSYFRELDRIHILKNHIIFEKNLLEP